MTEKQKNKYRLLSKLHGTISLTEVKHNNCTACRRSRDKRTGDPCVKYRKAEFLSFYVSKLERNITCFCLDFIEIKK